MLESRSKISSTQSIYFNNIICILLISIPATLLWFWKQSRYSIIQRNRLHKKSYSYVKVRFVEGLALCKSIRANLPLELLNLNQVTFTLKLKKKDSGTSLAVQWLRCHTSNAGSLGSNPSQRTKIPYAMQKRKKKRKNKWKSDSNVKGQTYHQWGLHTEVPTVFWEICPKWIFPQFLFWLGWHSIETVLKNNVFISQPGLIT